MPLQHTVQEIRLASGAKGLLVDVPGATVFSYDISFRAGDEFTRSRAIHQTAHLLEHVVLEGSKQYPSARLLSQAFTKNGASFNASTGATSLSYYGDSAAMEWKRILELQLEVITEPLLLEPVIEKEKQTVGAELSDAVTNFGAELYRLMAASMGLTTFSPAQRRETLVRITADDLREHYTRTHTLSNMRFCIAGDVKAHASEIAAMFESLALPIGDGRLLPRREVPHRGSPITLHRPELSSVYFTFMLSLPRIVTDDEENALEVLNHVLVGTMHSRIYGVARDRGLTYDISTDISIDPDGTTTEMLYGSFEPEKGDELMELIRDELRLIATEPIDDVSLDEVKQYGLGSFQQSYQTVGTLIGAYNSRYFFDETIKNVEETPRQIRRTTATQVTRIAKELLDTAVWAYGEVGPIDEAVTHAHNRIIEQIFTK